MESLKKQASIYYLGLHIGYYSKSDVIKWSDEVIEKTKSEVDYRFIELSLSSSKSKESIASKLVEIIDHESFEDTAKIIYGVCLKKLKDKQFTLDEVATYLYRIANVDQISISEEEFKMIMYLSDGYYLATEGMYGDIEKIYDDTILFLEEYAVYLEEFKV